MQLDICSFLGDQYIVDFTLNVCFGRQGAIPPLTMFDVIRLMLQLLVSKRNKSVLVYDRNKSHLCVVRQATVQRPRSRVICVYGEIFIDRQVEIREDSRREI